MKTTRVAREIKARREFILWYHESDSEWHPSFYTVDLSETLPGQKTRHYLKSSTDFFEIAADCKAWLEEPEHVVSSEP